MAELMEAGRLDFTSLLDAERAELLGFLGDLDMAEWAAPTECPAWSVKGVALHLLGDDLSILSRQRDGEPSPVLIEAGSDWQSLFVALDRRNEQWVAASSDFSVRLLADLLRLCGEEIHRWYSTVDPDLLGEAIPWVGPEPAPYWLLCAREYLERWIHHSQIRRSLDRGEWFDERWVDAAVAVAVRGFPAGLAALPAPDGATVTLAVDGGPAWTVRHDDGSWRLYDGWSDNASVALRLDRPEAALLVSRGMTKAEVVERLELEGDDELCQLFSIGLSAFFGR